LVVAVEYLLLRLAFRSMCNGGRLDEPLSGGSTLKIAVLANLASLLIGFVGFFF
jgi:hypothetical protein